MTKIDRRGQFNITGIDPRLIIQTAFTGSRPQGLGFLHHRPGGLSEDELNEIAKPDSQGNIRLDYLRGRSMKLNLMRDRDSGEIFFDLDWCDHGREAAAQLMRDVGLPDVEAAIAKAFAEKKELEDEWEAREIKGALFALKFISEGQTTSPNDIYKYDDNDPIYMAWAFGVLRARREGWVEYDKASQSYTITEKGRSAMAEKAEGPAKKDNAE